MKTHAQVPTPLLCDGFIRVYFSSRPEKGLSLTTYVDLDADNPEKIIRINHTPILDLGKPGTFDEHGIMPSCALRNGDAVYLYYSGWSRTVSVPYNNLTGLAVSTDGGITFSKVSEGPVLGKSIHDPYSATSPFVMKEGDAWHMWYCSGTGWLEINGKFEHIYDIKYARSCDGIIWIPHGKVAITQQNEDEAITRPVVVRGSKGYHMWFCYRGSYAFRDGENAYRIGYAYSDNLIDWCRNDENAGIYPSDKGWDSTMVAYPAVVTFKGRGMMFFNGNGFGESGFGYAVLQLRKALF